MHNLVLFSVADQHNSLHLLPQQSAHDTEPQSGMFQNLLLDALLAVILVAAQHPTRHPLKKEPKGGQL